MRQRKNKPKIRNKKRFYTILAIIFIIITSGAVYGAYTYNKLKNPEDLFVPTENTWEEVEEEEEIDINEQFDKSKINIMLVGFDRDKERSKKSDLFRTDTNIVVTIDLEEKSVDMVSIPRDSYVTIAHRGGKDKFNSAYGYGYRFGPTDDKEKDGFKYIMDTASELLGNIPINYYVAVDMDVVKEIIDAIGGVEVEVPNDLYKNYGKDRSGIVVKEGFQKLDGYGLLYYARYRHYPKGDIERAENQQKILVAIFDSLKKSNKFTALPKVYQSVQKNLKTNMNLNQIAALALFGKDMNKESIDTRTIDGFFGNLDGLSYWIINQKERVKLIEDVYGVSVAMQKQDPTNNNLTKLDVSISKNILEIGQTAQITAKGTTALGDNKKFEAGEIVFSTSNSNIVSVEDSGLVRAKGAGNATITAKAEKITKQVNVTVNAPKDEKAPVITLKGASAITITVGQNYTDAGATAQDNIDGNITTKIVTSGTVNIKKAGEYIIRYNVSDKAGNAAKEVTRKVIVKAVEEQKDEKAPVITLKGASAITITAGQKYTDAGATAQDNIDGNITTKIVTSGTVNIKKAGEYIIRYNVSDKAGNAAKEVTRKVIVKAVEKPEEPKEPEKPENPATP